MSASKGPWGWWVDRARGVAQKIALASNEPVDIEDVYRHVKIPSDMPPNVRGAVFKPRGWVCCGYERARRREAHGRVLRKWRWVGEL